MNEGAGLGGRRLVGDAVIIQLGRTLQIVVNLVTFVALARGLGAEGFGLFSTIVALLATGFAVADLGLGQFSVRAVAQRREEDIRAVRDAIPSLYLCSTIVLAVSCAAIAPLTGGGANAVIACALIGTSYVHAQARVGVERGLWLGALQVLRATAIELTAAALRTAAVLLVWAAGGRSVTAYAWAIALSGAGTLVIVHRWFGFPTNSAPPSPSLARQAIREALPFGLSSLTWNALVEVPKLLLAPMSGAIVVGHYAAGARVLAVASLPLQSVLNVVTPRVFAAANHRPAGPLRIRAFLQSAGMVTALGMGLALLVITAAPVLPAVIGGDYGPAVPVLRILAISLPFQALAFAAGDWLGGIGRQRLRLLLTVAALVIAIPLVFFAARTTGAVGAAWSFTALTGALAGVTTLACWRLLRL